MHTDMSKPPVCPGEKILFIGAAFPPSVGGSVVVMKQLLKHYSPMSYNVVTLKSAGDSGDADFERHTLRIGTKKIRPYNLGLWVRFLQMPFCVAEVCRYAKKVGSTKIVCIFPTIDFLFLGNMVAKKTALPLIVYMHDTVAEALSKTTFAWPAVLLQKSVFRRAAKILVMSEGMRRLYEDKYGLNCVSIPHTYGEKIDVPSSLTGNIAHQLFWGGAVYGINEFALRRVLAASQKRNIPFLFTSRNKEILAKSLNVSIGDSALETTYYDSREAYLEALKTNGIMVLALDYPEESGFGAEEVATIFPTKTPEYLASGAPILVHCPSDYFLARFFKERNCGVVVSEKDSAAISRAIDFLLKGGDQVTRIRENALKAAEEFSARHICELFSKALMEA